MLISSDIVYRSGKYTASVIKKKLNNDKTDLVDKHIDAYKASLVTLEFEG